MSRCCVSQHLREGSAQPDHVELSESDSRCRACLKLHAAEANTNYPPQDYEGELEAAALLSAVPLSAAGAPGASEAGNSDDEDARRSELELSAMHGVLQTA